MAISKLDTFYRGILLSKYFVKGWGDPEGMKRLLKFRKIVSNRESCYKLVDASHPVTITSDQKTGGVRTLEGFFHSPFDKYLPGLLPEEAKKAFFQVILPEVWQSESFKPVCLHMAGTGDHFFWRRRKFMAKPLLKEGIGSIILENPFYGMRKPNYQVRSVLHNVSDIFIMGGCLMLEALVLFHWCEQQGFGPLGVTGLSMGGHMASLAATNWPKPLIVVPCLSWSTASGVFTKGVMSRAINWDMLASQYRQNEIFRREIRQMFLHSNEGIDDAYRAGQKFAQDFPRSMVNIINTKSSFRNSDVLQDKTRINVDNRAVFFPSYNIMEFLKSKFLIKQDVQSLIYSPQKDVIEYCKNGVEDHMLFHEAVNFMRGIMDECTHLKNFSVPVDTSLIICVFAQKDGYVPRDNCTDITTIWPGAEVRPLNAGHVSAFVLYLSVFRNAIVDAFQRFRKKYS